MFFIGDYMKSGSNLTLRFPGKIGISGKVLENQKLFLGINGQK